MLTSSYLPARTDLAILDLTVGGLLAQQAVTRPDALALVGRRHGTGDVLRLTYAELYDQACRVATGLAALARPGEMVALWAPNVVEWPVIQYGAALAGVVLVALNPVWREAEVEYALQHCGARILLHADSSRDYDLAAVAARLAARLPGLVTISLREHARWCPAESGAAVVAAAPADAAAPVMLQYTSGTTGNPKGVLLRHRSLVNVARMTTASVGVPDQAVTVNPLPMFHSAACVIGTLGPACVGGSVILIPEPRPDLILAAITEEGAQVLFCVPTLLDAVVEAQQAQEAEPASGGRGRLELVVAGASTVPGALIERTERVFGAAVVTVFGQTELAPVLAATRPGDSRERQLSTVGRPLPQVEVKVVDPVTGVTLPIGETGEICARGYQQFIEYLHDPGATAAAIDGDGFVHTGDLAHMDGEGYLTLAGRLKELIIRGGENISAVEVETVLMHHPAVHEAVVVGVPDPRWGEIVVALLRLWEPAAPGLGSELDAFMRERLSPYKIPARWYSVDELPLTATGKVRRFQLVRRILEGGYEELS